MSILIDSSAASLCQIAQRERFLVALSGCCNSEMEFVEASSGSPTHIICVSCESLDEVYCWPNGMPMPPRIALHQNMSADIIGIILTWLSTWTGIAQDELSIEVAW